MESRVLRQSNGRPRGTRAELTWGQIIEIRSKAGFETQDTTALRFGVSQRMVSKIQRGEAWKRNPTTRVAGEIDGRREARFWALVEKTETCWLWHGCIEEPTGYGRTSTGSRCAGTFKVWLVHRLSWVMHNGPIPQDRWVLHRCDVRACVRPDHLFLGTHAENMQDAARKGRLGVVGVMNGASRLTDIDVRCIRTLGGVVSTSDLARNFAVSRGTITNVIKRKVWKHIP